MLRTRCYETERSLFLQPIVEAIAPVVASASADTLSQLLGEHAAAAAGLLPEVAAILGPPPPGRGSMEMERRRAFEAVRACPARPGRTPPGAGPGGRPAVRRAVDGRAHALPRP